MRSPFTLFGLSILCLLANASADDPPTPAAKFKSPAARKAEAEFEKAVAAADKDYLAKVRVAQSTFAKELEKARSAATKSGDLEDAVAIRDRLKELTDSAPNPKSRKRPAQATREQLARDLADSEWVGSPNWGRFALHADGSVTYEKDKDRTSRWGAISHETIGVINGAGQVSILKFDVQRRTMKAYYPGQIGNSTWNATRTPTR